MIPGAAALASFALLDALNLAGFAAAWLVGAVALIVTLKPPLSRWIRETATREQDDIIASLQPPGIERSKLLVLCARGDEVRGWLRTLDVTAQVTFVIGCALLWIVKASARSNLPTVADGIARSTLDAGLDQLRFFGFDGWALTVGVLALCAFCAMFMIRSVEIGTDSFPRADPFHPAHRFDIPFATLRKRVANGNLRHKAICDEPTVVAAIANWIAHEQRPAHSCGLQGAAVTRDTHG